MYAMTAKKDNVVSLKDVKQSKLHAAMDQIGEDYTAGFMSSVTPTTCRTGPRRFRS